MARTPKMNGQPLASMAETMRVRAGDFFVLDEHATIDINGGYPPVYLLNEGMLDDLRSDSLPLLSDASAAEGLPDLVHDELVGYGTSGDNELARLSNDLGLDVMFSQVRTGVAARPGV